MKRVRFEVYGRVQGVFFRKYTCMKAEQLRLRGYVQNTVRRRRLRDRAKGKTRKADRTDVFDAAAKHRARRSGRTCRASGTDEDVAVPRRIAHVARGKVRVCRRTKRGRIRLRQLRRASHHQRMKTKPARSIRGGSLLLTKQEQKKPLQRRVRLRREQTRRVGPRNLAENPNHAPASLANQSRNAIDAINASSTQANTLGPLP